MTHFIQLSSYSDAPV